MKYIVKEVSVKKIQKGENTVILVNGGDYQLVLNPTALEVFDIMDKFSTTEQLLEQLCQIYGGVDKRVLEKDLNEILRIFEIYGLITIEKEEKENDGVSKYIISGDVNYQLISDFVLKTLECDEAVKFGQKSPEYYMPVFLRYRVMQNLEFGVYAESGSKVVGYMSTSANPANSSKTLVINDIFMDESLSDDEIVRHLSGMINRVFRIVASTRAVSKIRLATYGEMATQRMIDILLRIGFEVEGVLKDETLLGDMTFYTYFVK